MNTRIAGFLFVLVAPASLAASLSISPSSGAGGKQVTLTASGFDQDGIGYNTGFLINGGTVAVCPQNARANCSVQVSMPGAAPGPVQVTASNSAGEIAHATYTVAQPQFYVTPACGQPGDTITAKGKFFAVNADAGIQFDGSYVATNNYPDAEGNFSRSIQIPGYAFGTYAVSVSNSAGNSGFQMITVPCQVIGDVDDVAGPVYRCTANCDAPNPADRTLVPVNRGDPVYMGDRYETGDDGRVNFTLDDNTQMTLGQRGRLTIDDYVYDPGSNSGSEHYTVLGGAFSYLSGLIGKKNDPDHIVETPYGCIGIRGTWFVTRLDEVLQRQETYLSSGEIGITPNGPGLESPFIGPVTIFHDASGVTSSAFVDSEADGVADPVDNCTQVANATQRDSDGDGYGNVCDGDLNESGLTTATDFNLLRSCLNQPSTASQLCAAADMNGSGLVTSTDFSLLRARLNTVPGPSGWH